MKIFRKHKKERKPLFDSGWSRERLMDMEDEDFLKIRNKLYVNALVRIFIGLGIIVICLVMMGKVEDIKLW